MYKCHTTGNHKKGGKLYGLKPKLKPFKGATFMTAVRWDMIEKLKDTAPDVEFHFSYGQAAKESRKMPGIKKTHANDTYALGTFHPKWRANTIKWKKRRRNNRILEKFYDAVYTDMRDGVQKKGAALSCGRTNRSEPRQGPVNERPYRAMRAVKKTRKGFAVSRGRRSIRTKRYAIQPSDIVLYKNKRFVAGGMHNKGAAVMLNGKSVTAANVRVLRHADGWIRTN